jgi:hypothetical protein
MGRSWPIANVGAGCASHMNVDFSILHAFSWSPGTASGRLPSPLPLNIVFKLIDDEFLIAYCAFNQVTN